MSPRLSKTKIKKIAVKSFIKRKEEYYKFKNEISLEQSYLYVSDNRIKDVKEQSFAEQFNKYRLRDFQNNTRMNIKNQEYTGIHSHNTRNRMVDYWKNCVIPNHLPPIGVKKR